MTKLEKEIKILNIDKNKIQEKLKNLGAKFVSSNIQKVYVYDLPSIYTRYLDCINLLNSHNKEYEKEVLISKLKGVLVELEDLLDNEDIEKIFNITGGKKISDYLEENSLSENKEIFCNKEILSVIQKYNINPNKWVRLRQTGDKTTLTVKHIVNNNNDDFQKVLETEMEVPSIEICNNMLYQLGFVYRNYQEKERISYILEDVEIDIDSWPHIPTYLEIENDNIDKIKSIVLKLELNDKEIVSCNTVEIYKKYGLDVYSYRELKF